MRPNKKHEYFALSVGDRHFKKYTKIDIDLLLELGVQN